MSASAQPVPPQSTLSVAPGISSSTRIQVVTGQKINVRTSAWPFILIASLLVILTIALPMVVNTQMAQRAYEIRDQHVQKGTLQPGDRIIVLGGPAMLIGLGGGAATFGREPIRFALATSLQREGSPQ